MDLKSITEVPLRPLPAEPNTAKETEQLFRGMESQLLAGINLFHPSFEPALRRFRFPCESNYKAPRITV
jgi:hypothetical protein